MDELRDLDQVAYVRFASVYRSFQDINAFRIEIERLQSPRRFRSDEFRVMSPDDYRYMARP